MQGQNYNPLQNTLEWFQKALPHQTCKNAQVQMGVHFEEVKEMLDCITAGDGTSAALLRDAKEALHALAEDMKQNQNLVYTLLPHDRLNMIDAIADQLVTAVGSAHTFDMDPVGALDEVNASNYSKFVDGQAIFNKNGKIAKGPDYYRPDLRPYISA